ncbi:MucBP domain-containing protein [Lactococcus allomyrinae]|uniref:MucBP domain-containing protein n=1 Tax=Lactococcus allomyrinae TaxID=2419773 RepID=A0A387BQ11_9LACT|nr:MucBP domain-containing protein [Lactococcus allomyrinae]AYG00591.1 hypothetical protein D7I46_05480 [Lactococcus allomyrinae]
MSHLITQYYEDENGNEISPNTARIDSEKGGIVYAPVLEGYMLVKTVSTSRSKFFNRETIVTHTYTPVGCYIIKSPNGAIEEIIYPNGWDNPKKFVNPQNTIPYFEGYRPKTSGNFLEAVDLDNIDYGYLFPELPDDLTQDIIIEYIQNKEFTTKLIDATTVTYVYGLLGNYIVRKPDGNTDRIMYENDSNNPSKVNNLLNKVPFILGYRPESSDGRALLSINPSDPSQGYLLPEISSNPTQDIQITYIQTHNEIITNYVDNNGNEVAPSTRRIGEVGDTYTTMAPILDGYVLTTIPSNISGTLSKDETQVTYIYSRLGSYVVTKPDGSMDDTIYPNDLSDPTQAGISTNVIPYISGYTPEQADGVVLTLVDNEKPILGYWFPTPSKVTENTLINYIKNKSVVTINYLDQRGKILVPSIRHIGDVGDNYITAAVVIDNYFLINYPDNAQGTLSEDEIEVNYVYDLLGDIL